MSLDVEAATLSIPRLSRVVNFLELLFSKGPFFIHLPPTWHLSILTSLLADILHSQCPKPFLANVIPVRIENQRYVVILRHHQSGPVHQTSGSLWGYPL